VHRAGRPAQCAAWARQAGFEHVSLDLIYGTPGESGADWRRSLDAAVAAAPDHVSAYALTVETGTRLAARVRRGELDPPDDDVLADRYAAADEILGGLLLLDSVTVALIITLPVGLVIWVSMLRYLIRGVIAANRGERCEVPDWICARIVS